MFDVFALAWRFLKRPNKTLHELWVNESKNWTWFSPQEWRYEVLGASDKPYISLLNRVERGISERGMKLGYKKWLSADSVLCACFLEEKAITVSYEAFCSVELNGELTRGQACVDVIQSKSTNVMMISTVDEKLVKDMLLWIKEWDDSGSWVRWSINKSYLFIKIRTNLIRLIGHRSVGFRLLTAKFVECYELGLNLLFSFSCVKEGLESFLKP